MLFVLIHQKKKKKAYRKRDQDKPDDLGQGQPTNETKCSLCESKHAGIQQKAQVVGTVLQGEHAEHYQEKASLWGRPQAWSWRVLVCNGLQGDGLDT